MTIYKESLKPEANVSGATARKRTRPLNGKQRPGNRGTFGLQPEVD